MLVDLQRQHKHHVCELRQTDQHGSIRSRESPSYDLNKLASSAWSKIILTHHTIVAYLISGTEVNNKNKEGAYRATDTHHLVSLRVLRHLKRVLDISTELTFAAKFGLTCSNDI